MDAATVRAKLTPFITEAIEDAKNALASLDMDADKTLRARVRISVLRTILNKLDDAVTQGTEIDRLTFSEWTQ